MRIKIINSILLASSLAIVPVVSSGEKIQKGTIEPKALQTLKRMSDYLNNMRDFSFHASVSVDVIDGPGEKIEYQRQSDIKVQRPNRLYVNVVGDLQRLRFFYNGKNITMYNPELNVYGVVKAKGTIESTLDDALVQFGIQTPLTEIIYKKNYKLLIENAVQGRYLGLSQINGVQCHHLSFVQPDLSWQIWIDSGEKPLPRKVVFTNTLVNGWPNFSAVLSQWNESPKFSSSLFEFSPPKKAMRIDVIKSMHNTNGALS